MGKPLKIDRAEALEMFKTGATTQAVAGFFGASYHTAREVRDKFVKGNLLQRSAKGRKPGGDGKKPIGNLPRSAKVEPIDFNDWVIDAAKALKENPTLKNRLAATEDKLKGLMANYKKLSDDSVAREEKQQIFKALQNEGFIPAHLTYHIWLVDERPLTADELSLTIKYAACISIPSLT